MSAYQLGMADMVAEDSDTGVSLSAGVSVTAKPKARNRSFNSSNKVDSSSSNKADRETIHHISNNLIGDTLENLPNEYDDVGPFSDLESGLSFLGRAPAVLDEHTAAVTRLCCPRRVNLFVSSSLDGSIRLWSPGID